ncbi:transposase [Pseudenhygromyxa sp. WMMC2535]|nr:transposase [Pseudenhygromyxa sp. WMMC2535]
MHRLQRSGVKGEAEIYADVVVLDSLDFIGRLAALIPPPSFHMIRYHGVLAGHAKRGRGETQPPRGQPGRHRG